MNSLEILDIYNTTIMHNDSIDLSMNILLLTKTPLWNSQSNLNIKHDVITV